MYRVRLMDLRQLAGDELPKVAPYPLQSVALLRRETLEAFLASGIHFDSEPDRFGIGGRPWAAIELADGTLYVLVHHRDALEPKVEVRAREEASTSDDLVARLCSAVGISRELVLAVAGQPSDESGAAAELPRERPFSGLVSRLRDRGTWGSRRVLTGQPRTRISTRAMEQIPKGYAYYAPPPISGHRPRRRWRRWLTSR